MKNTMVADVSQDWATACDVSSALCNMRRRPRTASATRLVASNSRALGGDCYDFLPLSHNQLAFAIGDASGKNLPAALMTASVQSSRRAAIVQQRRLWSNFGAIRGLTAPCVFPVSDTSSGI